MLYLNKLIDLAQQIANERSTFFTTKGPGLGDKDTSAFMFTLHERAKDIFGNEFIKQFAEQKICGYKNNFKVDFYFPEEAVIVEIALTLRNASREFEKDIIKAILAKRAGRNINTLCFLSKPGAIKRNEEPGPQSIIAWVGKDYGIKVVTIELENKHIMINS